MTGQLSRSNFEMKGSVAPHSGADHAKVFLQREGLAWWVGTVKYGIASYIVCALHSILCNTTPVDVGHDMEVDDRLPLFRPLETREAFSRISLQTSSHVYWRDTRLIALVTIKDES